MSLIGALNLGKTALTTHQAALQVTGNNIANAGNPNYTRQAARIAPGGTQQIRPGMFIGTGVNLESITRQIDEALEGRLRAAGSDAEGAATTQEWLGRIESAFNELSDQDLSTQLSTFFNSWSNLANKPGDDGLRQIVITNGTSVAKWVKNVRDQLEGLSADLGDRIKALAADTDRLAKQIADLNQQIVVAEGGTGGEASNLRDQRDAALKDLANLIDIKTTQGENGQVNVYVGSAPLVNGTATSGITTKQTTVNGDLVTRLVFKSNGGDVQATSGELGALLQVRTQHLQPTIDSLDKVTGSLIFELNKVHSQGMGTKGFGSVTSIESVVDPNASLAADTGLDFHPANGSFTIFVRDLNGNVVNSGQISVKVGVAGTADTTLNSLVASINNPSTGVGNVTASIVGGRLKLDITGGNPNLQMTFGDDSSGLLAALGVNTFFTGHNATDIGINSVVANSASMLAVATGTTANGAAQAIAKLESDRVASLSGSTLKESYQSMINTVAVQAAASKTNAEAAAAVQQTLQGQREALSGVSMDEEAVNLMREQRAFQGAARLIAAVDEMMKTILQLV